MNKNIKLSVSLLSAVLLFGQAQASEQNLSGALSQVSSGSESNSTAAYGAGFSGTPSSSSFTTSTSTERTTTPKTWRFARKRPSASSVIKIAALVGTAGVVAKIAQGSKTPAQLAATPKTRLNSLNNLLGQLKTEAKTEIVPVTLTNGQIINVLSLVPNSACPGTGLIGLIQSAEQKCEQYKIAFLTTGAVLAIAKLLPRVGPHFHADHATIAGHHNAADKFAETLLPVPKK